MPDSAGSNDLYLSEVSPRDKPWDVHRTNALLVQKLYDDAGLQRYADRIGDCSNWLGFGGEAQDSGEIKLKLQQARFCRVRHCPVCQWRRTLMWQARFLQALPRVHEAYPTGRWVFLTLTVCNCPLNELKTTLQVMNKSWIRLVQRKDFPAMGFIRAAEVTRSANGEAHPHFHCLLLVPSSYFSHGYMTQARWTELWKQALRADYTPVVNVKAVKPKKGTDPAKAAIAGVLETLKYQVKEQDLIADSAWLTELTRQLHKTRAVSVGGVLRKFLSEDDPEDLIHTEDAAGDSDSEIEFWFGWRENLRRYAKT